MSDRCITPVVNLREIISVLFKKVDWKKYWNMNLCMTKHYCNLLLFSLLLMRSSTHMFPLLSPKTYAQWNCKNENVSRIKTFVGKTN